MQSSRTRSIVGKDIREWEQEMKLLLGDCLELMKTIPSNSVDSIVTDPPYGLSFMGKKWDYEVPSKEIWKEALRVLKPGGHLLSFGGTRTYHRLVVNIEDAGFEIRDCIQWLYGSGFPKSTDVSKRIDKEAGAEREVLEMRESQGGRTTAANPMDRHAGVTNKFDPVTAPSTDSAKQWQGWGTALKPANEPICVARKPLEKGLTVAENVLKWGTGAININDCRIATADNLNGGAYSKDNGRESLFGMTDTGKNFQQPNGRWPANIILDEEAAMALDEQSGHLKSGGQNYSSNAESMFGTNKKFSPSRFAGDSGGASRFFYVAKSSKRERGEGNNHPTVKPIKLMEYLIKLVTPPSGTVLDPFMGSGTTGFAAKKLGFDFIGCEMSEDYFKICEKRIENVAT